MEKISYYLNYGDIIINTMIVINQKSNRRIIDDKDIKDFEKKFMDLCKSNNIDIIISPMDDYASESLNSYVLNNDGKIIMLPWLDKSDLIENFRAYLPLNICLVLCKKELKDMLIDRTDEELKQFKNKEIDTAKFYEADIKRTINNIETKKALACKRLLKIRELNKQ